MELVVALAFLLVAAAAVTVLVIVLRRRRAERERLRGEEMRSLDERISERLDELAGRPRSRPETGRTIERETGRTIEPRTTPDEAAPTLVIGTTEPQAIDEGPRPPAPSPPAETQTPRPMRVGRARPQAVAGTVRTRGRSLPRNVLVAVVAGALFVVVGSQVLGSHPPAGRGTPSPTNVSGAVATPTSAPTLGATPTSTGGIPTATPLPTPTLGGSSPTPLATPRVYTVRRGDTMTSIAEAFGVPIADLIAANPQIQDPSLIYAGNVLTIPTSGRPRGASPTASTVP